MNNLNLHQPNTQERILNQLQSIHIAIKSPWLALWRGLLTGFGSIIGAAIAVVLIGWFLSIIGVIPALQHTADEWRQALEQNRLVPPAVSDTAKP